MDFDEFHESINEIENYLIELEKEELGKKKGDIIYKLNYELFRTDDKLDKEMLCESCKEKKIEEKKFNRVKRAIS